MDTFCSPIPPQLLQIISMKEGRYTCRPGGALAVLAETFERNIKKPGKKSRRLKICQLCERRRKRTESRCRMKRSVSNRLKDEIRPKATNGIPTIERSPRITSRGEMPLKNLKDRAIYETKSDRKWPIDRIRSFYKCNKIVFIIRHSTHCGPDLIK